MSARERDPSRRPIRFIESGPGGQSPDIQVERAGQPIQSVEVTTVTGRYPSAWQYRASVRVDPLTGKVTRLHFGSRPPTRERIEASIGRKASAGQLRPPAAPAGGIIELHVAARGTSAWATIAAAVRGQAADLASAGHVKALVIVSRGARVVVTRNAAGQVAVVAEPDARPAYQAGLRAMTRRLPTIDAGGARGAPLTAPGLSPRGGAAISQISRGPGATGGIDFSSLELRYVADRAGRGLRYAFRAPSGAGDSAVGLRMSQDASDVFNRYLESVRNGEWTVQRRVTVDGREYAVTTVFGGVDFSRTPTVGVVRRQFRARWPQLVARVGRSMRRPVRDAQGAVWLGGGSG